MKTKRKIEILEMMLEKLNDEEYIKSFKGDEGGLCITTQHLRNNNIIDRFEEDEIDDMVLKSTSYRNDPVFDFIYKPGSIAPRKKLLIRLINQLKNK